jgi:hypothetical protein
MAQLINVVLYACHQQHVTICCSDHRRVTYRYSTTTDVQLLQLLLLSSQYIQQTVATWDNDSVMPGYV